MFCSKCGKNITEPIAFCSNCGAPLSKSPSASANTSAQNTVQENINDEPSLQKPNVNGPDFIPYQKHTENIHQDAPEMYSQPPLYNAEPPVYNAEPPVYNATPPVYKTAAPKKKGKAGKVVGIVFGVIAAILACLVLIPLLVVAIIFIVGAFNNTAKDAPVVEVNPTYEVTTEAEYDYDLYNDPVYYFRAEKKSYYKVSNSPSADLYIYTDFNSMDTYYDILTPNTLVYVYGIEDGWACIEYPAAHTGYAWCMADSIRITDDVPDANNKYEDPIHYFSSYEKAYYRVYGTNNKGLNLRTEPNTDCEIITVLQESEQVLVYGIEDGWAYVKTADPRTQSDLYGWCTTEYLKYYNDYYGE